MSRIIRVTIQNSLYQNKNRDEVLVRRILNFYPNYPTHRLYFGEVETPYYYSLRFGVGSDAGATGGEGADGGN